MADVGIINFKKGLAVVRSKVPVTLLAPME